LQTPAHLIEQQNQLLFAKVATDRIIQGHVQKDNFEHYSALKQWWNELYLIFKRHVITLHKEI
jgi:hypothetical protein